MENNSMFGTLLRSLGFKVYGSGARVRAGPAGYWGCESILASSDPLRPPELPLMASSVAHMINFVTIEGKKYHVDVGFGANGPVQPLLLNKEEMIFDSIKPAAHRLVWKNIDGNTDPDQRLWVLEHRIDQGSPWNELYCYTELEFLEGDYGESHRYISMILLRVRV